MTIPPLPPTHDHERHVLELAMTECRKRLRYFRDEGDDLNADLAESDLNQMLERWGKLDATDS